MLDRPPLEFLNIPVLLEQSQPVPRKGWLWYGAGLFLLVVLASTFAGAQSPAMEAVVRVISGLGMIGLMIGLAIFTWFIARQHRAEQIQLEAIEELVTLRRWPQAAVVLESLLSRPTRTPQTRVHALIYLTSVLVRYHRFDDAIAVQEHLLNHVMMDENTAHALRLGRAMAMLREDHLVDADRAISEMRRRVGRDPVREPGQQDDASRQPYESAGLALIEIYRDVKTGHPAEAIEIFNRKLPVLRQQLGHRVGDAWALAARAYDLMNQTTEAQNAFENATLLSPVSELSRRYPEVALLIEKYRPAPAPAEAA